LYNEVVLHENYKINLQLIIYRIFRYVKEDILTNYVDFVLNNN